MDIKIVCDRCFEDISSQGLFYRKGHTFGSCTYCESCHEKIEKEFKQEELDMIVQRNFKKLLSEQNKGTVYSLNHIYEDSNSNEFFEVIRRFA